MCLMVELFRGFIYFIRRWRNGFIALNIDTACSKLMKNKSAALGLTQCSGCKAKRTSQYQKLLVQLHIAGDNIHG